MWALEQIKVNEIHIHSNTCIMELWYIKFHQNLSNN